MCVVVGLLALLALAGWLFVTPVDYVPARGLRLNPRAALDWRARVGVRAPVLSLTCYIWLFRTWIVLAWVAYAGLIGAIYRGARFGPLWTLSLIHI